MVVSNMNQMEISNSEFGVEKKQRDNVIKRTPSIGDI